MSRLRSIALAMKDRIEEIADLKGNVVVYHLKNIESEFDSRMARAKGKAVIIRLLSATNVSRHQRTCRLSGAYTVTLFIHPALTPQDVLEADILMDAIREKIQGWWPADIEPKNDSVWCDIESQAFPEHPVYDCSVFAIQAPKSTV